MAREAAVGAASATRNREASPERKTPSWRARLALIVIGLLFPLMLAEITLRVAGAILPGDYQTVSFAEAHPEFGRRNKPGAGWKKTSEFTSWIEVNSKSLRGAEIDYPKPAGEYRILVVGDSFTFAEQVNQDETFTQRLEDRLNAEGGGQKYRVLNAGSNGWATANEAVYLTKEGIRFSPDLVIVALYIGNDVSDNYRRVATVQNAVDADLALRGADSLEGPRRILRRSELYTVFESGVLAKLPWWGDDGGSSSSDRRAPRTQAEAEEAWAITEGLLDRMRDVTESKGARFVVMVIPTAVGVVQRGGTGVRETEDEEEDEDDLKPGFEDPHGSLAAILERGNITSIDLLQAMRRADNRVKDRLYYRQNAHFTAAGHAVAADELHDFLVERGLTRAGAS